MVRAYAKVPLKMLISDRSYHKNSSMLEKQIKESLKEGIITSLRINNDSTLSNYIIIPLLSRLYRRN